MTSNKKFRDFLLKFFSKYDTNGDGATTDRYTVVIC